MGAIHLVYLISIIVKWLKEVKMWDRNVEFFLRMSWICKDKISFSCSNSNDSEMDNGGQNVLNKSAQCNNIYHVLSSFWTIEKSKINKWPFGDWKFGE
jgi:hypothetical protein